jgi:hypothetical protein
LKIFFPKPGARTSLGDVTGKSMTNVGGLIFFIDSDRSKLLPIAEHLANSDYEFVGTLDPDESDETPIYYLRLDRIETHSPTSLHERNQLLYAVAAQFGVLNYDGMDVGAVAGP